MKAEQDWADEAALVIIGEARDLPTEGARVTIARQLRAIRAYGQELGFKAANDATLRESNGVS